MLRRLETCLILAVAAARLMSAAGEQDSIRSGPVYTTLTIFPEVRVLVALPPTAKPEMAAPATFSLKVDNGPATLGIQVQTLADTGLGMAAVVMLDVSGSMSGGPLNAVRAGLVKFTSEATLSDRVAICTVADETRWDSNWNDSPDQLKVALAGLKPRGSLTRLWDGLVEVLAKYPENPIARRLVVVSDGHDEGSQHTLDDVIAAAAQQHVVIDSIGVTRSDPKFLLNLAKLSNVTGGLHRPAPSMTALELLVGGGIKRYRTIPVVTFKPEGVAADGKAHSFLVTWKGSGTELQSTVESLVPEEPKSAAISTTSTKVQPSAKQTEAKSSEPKSTLPASLDQIPKLWLYIGGGVLGAIVLAAIAFFALRGKKAPAKPSYPQPVRLQANVFQQPPPNQPPPFSFDPPKPVNTGAFVGDSIPTGSKGSVYIPLPTHVPQSPESTQQQGGQFRVPTKVSPAAWLVCVEGPASGQSFPVDEAQYWIGANPGNQLVLSDDGTVSGNHACIAFENGSLGLFDHRSTNGLFVNDRRIADARHALSAGDRIRVGRSIFVVTSP